MRTYVDAHNHLHDRRLLESGADVISQCEELPIVYSVVNGTSPSDWGDVTRLAERRSWVIPSYGVHPWYLRDLPADWVDQLERALQRPGSVVGEIGIDYWMEGLDHSLQESVFLTQLRIARDLDRPVTIHGLRAWKRLLELLTVHGAPRRGFLLHSYTGPIDLVERFAALGGYFSSAPALLAPNRAKSLDTFRAVPLDRLLPETDSPDQPAPMSLDAYPLKDACGAPINHPCSIAFVYRELSGLRGIGEEELGQRLNENFSRLFRSV